MFERRPRAREKVTARPEHDRQCQKRGHAPQCAQHVHVQVAQERHELIIRRRQHGQRDRGCKPKLVHQLAIFARVGFFLLINWRIACCLPRLVAPGFNRGVQLRERCLLRQVIHRRFLRGNVDGRIQNARGGFQLVFDKFHARSAPEILDPDFDVCPADLKADGFDRAYEPRHIHFPRLILDLKPARH